jgi:hypothetical protein
MKLETTAIRAARAVVAHSAKLSFHLVKRSVQFTEQRPFLADFSRAKLSYLSALTILALVPAASSRADELSPPAQLPPAAEQMAKTYGLDSFGQIEGIRYTFNVEFHGAKVSRTWEWEPKTGKITYEGKDKDGNPVKVTYLRSELSTQPDSVKNGIDPNFFNDQYWLLFPLHVAWDHSSTVTDEGMQKLPLGEGSGERIVVKYPSDGGNYPGDTWELYLDADHRVEQFVFHRGSPKKPSLITATWEGYKKAGPLLISTEHRGTADGGPFHEFFTDVAVKLTGSDTWINAQ